MPIIDMPISSLLFSDLKNLPSFKIPYFQKYNHIYQDSIFLKNIISCAHWPSCCP